MTSAYGCLCLGMRPGYTVHARQPAPYGVAFDMDGNLYVAKHEGGTVDLIERCGSLIARLPAVGQNPTNRAFWNGSLYVTDDDSAVV